MKKQIDWFEVKVWLVIFVVSLLVALMVMYGDAKAGVVYTRDGWEGYVTMMTDFECDSARASYSLSDTIAPYATVVKTTILLKPWVMDSTFLRGSGLSLDSAYYMYTVSTALYPKGVSTPIYDIDYWYNDGPGRIVPASPSGSYVCRVYGYLSDIGSNYVSGAVVTAKLEKQIVYDTCSGMLVYDREKRTAPTGANGYFYFDLIRSSCLRDEKYVITVSKPRMADVRRTVTVPDSATYKLTWGN